MNIANLPSELKFVNRIGQTLSSEERISLESSVLKLSYEYSHEQWNFWGRVEGIIKNYYIV
jgi:radial spoke head protein 9